MLPLFLTQLISGRLSHPGQSGRAVAGHRAGARGAGGGGGGGGEAGEGGKAGGGGANVRGERDKRKVTALM